jgi:hypothetical protein
MAKSSRIDPEYSLRDVLDRVGPRPAPTADRADKKNYAERLSRLLAIMVGQALRASFPTVTPSETGRDQETPIGADGGKKRLDVKVWDDKLGLILNVSIKTYSFQDYSPTTGKLGRFTKNVLRNDHELRAEADVVHRRQPYSVLIGLVFMNADAARDGENSHSSFAHAVATFRKRTGRSQPDDPRYDRFESVYIGLYETEGPERGRTWYFDVTRPPSKNGIPNATLNLDQLVEAVTSTVAARNKTEIHYEDGELIGPDELEALEAPEEDE